MEKTETEKKTKKNDNRDIDLLKVQIYSDRVHAYFSAWLSFFLALLVGGIVLALTIQYGNTPYAEVISPTIMSGFFVIAGLGLRWVIQDYRKGLVEISKLMERVKKGNELLTLEKMLKKATD